MESVGIGLVGYGTVGSGVGRLLHESADEIRLATGKDVTLHTVCELSAERRALVPAGVRTTTDFGDLLHDPAIGVVIELIGGIEPARTFQLAALKSGSAETILLKSFMLRLAEKVAEREHANLIYTGDCLGQVASQTSGNLLAEGQGIGLPIMRPLVGFEDRQKAEILSWERRCRRRCGA